MKKIEAIIRPFKVENVMDALNKFGIQGASTTKINWYGKQEGHVEVYRAAEYGINYNAKVKISIIVSDNILEKCVSIIQENAKTSNIGDGEIFISSIDQNIRITPGETYDVAI